MERLRERMDGERGASLVEYALLVALIAVVCIAAVTFVGNSSSDKFDQSGSSIDKNADDDPSQAVTTTTDPGPDTCAQHNTDTDPSGWVHWTVHPDGSTEPYTPGPCP